MLEFLNLKRAKNCPNSFKLRRIRGQSIMTIMGHLVIFTKVLKKMQK